MQLETAYSYDDVLLIPQRSEIRSRSLVSLKTNLTKNFSLDIPIISSNMDSVTSPGLAIALGKLGGLGVLPRFNSIEEQIKNLLVVKKEGVKVGCSIGIKEGYEEKAQMLLNSGCDLLVIDVAHGHMQQVIEVTSNIKNKFPNLPLVSGNVATNSGADDLFSAGADIVKVGIGPGSICTTRIQTGHGVPQITALFNASLAAKKHNKTLIADGGIKNSGDIVKALSAGSHSVMLGNIFAGTSEAPGEIIEINGKKYKKYFGSTSLEQKQKHLEMQKNDPNYLNHIEGVSGAVPLIGSLESLIQNLKAGISSGLSYSGAQNISELHKLAKFIHITSGGLKESNFHNLEVSKN